MYVTALRCFLDLLLLSWLVTLLLFVLIRLVAAVFFLDVFVLSIFVMARTALWHARWAAHASEVEPAADFATHWLAELEAHFAALHRAESRHAAIEAELASVAVKHALGVALEARLALSPTVHAALDPAASLAAIGRAIEITTESEATAFVAANQTARAVLELTLQARTPHPAAAWRAAIATSGAPWAATAARFTDVANAAWPGSQSRINTAWECVIPRSIVEVLAGLAG